MKKLTIDVLIVLSGVFIIAATGHFAVFDPETGLVQEGVEAREYSIDIDQLPDPVQETLERDYTAWNPTEATFDINKEGVYYKVQMNNRNKRESKTVKISGDGNVISEEKHKPDSKGRQKEYTGRVWHV